RTAFVSSAAARGDESEDGGERGNGEHAAHDWKLAGPGREHSEDGDDRPRRELAEPMSGWGRNGAGGDADRRAGAQKRGPEQPRSAARVPVRRDEDDLVRIESARQPGDGDGVPERRSSSPVDDARTYGRVPPARHQIRLAHRRAAAGPAAEEDD